MFLQTTPLILTSNLFLEENLHSNLMFSERIDKAYEQAAAVCVCV